MLETIPQYNESSQNMDHGFFIAEQKDGKLGRPIGNEHDAVMFFEDLDTAVKVKNLMSGLCADLRIYKMNMSFAGEVVI